MSSLQTPDLSRSESAELSSHPQSSTSSQPASTVTLPKPLAQFSPSFIPPTPPTVTTPPNNSNAVSGSGPSLQISPRLTRPQLTSRMSSRAGGKRHASIGSQREMPFVLPAASTTATTAAPVPDSLTLSLPPTQTSSAQAETTAFQGWNARLREMGLHIPGMGSPTVKTPRSGSADSGAASPKSPEEQRVASYFSFRRRGSSGHAVSPGKSARSLAATPPPPPPPPPPPAPTPALIEMTPTALRHTHGPISQEPTRQTDPPRNRRANLSLDFGSTLVQRGSTASLPLVGHTPVEALVQQKSMMSSPIAPPPHVHTPPVHPPAYEYPFLPHHAPRKPLEVRVEEVPPVDRVGVVGDGGSWAITVRLPGLHPDGITIGTRRGRVLVIVADNYNDNDDGAGHFERRISFGYDADMANIRAEFNGDMLRVTVPRRAMFGLASLS
ncbi:hypothetical protein FRC10_009860 [Ceratobasidium sp. 414]|nr:hypothetical protein FRC10_009860 [Ceratobasidium sp. 414]